MKNIPGVIAGIALGSLCLIGAIALWIWAPEFSGFFDRGHSEPALPFYILLIGLAIVNFGYAWVSWFIQTRANPPSKAIKPPQDKPDAECNAKVSELRGDK